MRGLSRFLLGSALGAALGIVIAKSRRQKREKVSPSAYWEAAGAGVGAGLTDRVATAEAEPIVVTQSEPIVEAEPQVESEVVPEREAGPEIEPEAEPEAVVDTPPEPEPEPEPELVPVLEFVQVVEAEPEPEPEPEPAPEPEPGIIGLAAMFEPSFPDLGPTIDVVVAPDLLDEPLPGVGWKSSLEPLTEEDVEELFPMPADEEIVDFDKVPVIEAPPLNGGASTAAMTAPSISTDDLKARIEETRRRIRHELDEPFLGEGDTTSARDLQPEPATEPTAPPRIEPEVVAAEETGETPEQAPAPVAEVKEPVAAQPQPEMELGVDYNAMRARIEGTRGRLKAKAFDAMMSGESALLGRESPEKAAERPAPAVLDHDLDQTIETSLREEQD